MLAADIAQALGAKGRGPRWVARCPAHNDSEPSLSIGTGDDGRILLHCFAGCTFAAIASTPIIRGLLDDGREHDRRHDRPAPRPRPAPPQARTLNGIELPDAETMQKINRTIDRSKPLKGTTGARWLRDVRDLEPDLLDEEAVRWLPGSDRFPPSIVSVITAWTDASIVLGLQFTALANDGSTKLWRKFAAGSKPAGGVCRLVHDAEVTYELALGEGLETCLAAMTAQHRAGCLVRPTWAALTAGNLGTLGPLRVIERLMLLVDADVAGRSGAEKCAALWHQARREVRLATPTGVNDWNDRP